MKLDTKACFMLLLGAGVGFFAGHFVSSTGASLELDWSQKEGSQAETTQKLRGEAQLPKAEAKSSGPPPAEAKSSGPPPIPPPSSAAEAVAPTPAPAATAIVETVEASGVPKSVMPCTCVPTDSSWQKSTRSDKKCIFIDLGAANGNTFEVFMKDGYGRIADCPGGKWEAYLVEANPIFDEPLKKLAPQYNGAVVSMSSTAAWMCEATTSFYLMTANENNYWGSSLSTNHPDVKRSNYTKVTVPTMNLHRLLYEKTVPGDWVWLKIDIEGAEWDILPCLADPKEQSLGSRNVTLFPEIHPIEWGVGGTTSAQLEAAKTALTAKGVRIATYNSPTL